MRPWIEVAPGLRFTGDGAAWLPDEAAAVIADVHMGYARAARRRGGYLPAVEGAAALAGRVLALAGRVGARRLVIAGDLRHSTRDVDAAELAEVATFLDRLSALERVELVSGNHDRGAAGMVPLVRVGDVDVVHEPPATAPERWTVCGHLHPSTTVRAGRAADAGAAGVHGVGRRVARLAPRGAAARGGVAAAGDRGRDGGRGGTGAG